MHPKITQYLTNDNYYKMGYNYVEMEKKLKYGTVTLTSTFFHLTEVVKVAPKHPGKKVLWFYYSFTLVSLRKLGQKNYGLVSNAFSLSKT